MIQIKFGFIVLEILLLLYVTFIIQTCLPRSDLSRDNSDSPRNWVGNALKEAIDLGKKQHPLTHTVPSPPPGVQEAVSTEAG